MRVLALALKWVDDDAAALDKAGVGAALRSGSARDVANVPRDQIEVWCGGGCESRCAGWGGGPGGGGGCASR